MQLKVDVAGDSFRVTGVGVVGTVDELYQLLCGFEQGYSRGCADTEKCG